MNWKIISRAYKFISGQKFVDFMMSDFEENIE